MIGRLLIATSLAALVASPCDGRERRDRRPAFRDNRYTREVRIRQIERRITENHRLRDRQDRYGSGRRYRDFENDAVMDSIEEDE